MHHSVFTIREKVNQHAAAMRIELTKDDEAVLNITALMGSRRDFRNDVLFRNYIQQVVQSLPSLSIVK